MGLVRLALWMSSCHARCRSISYQEAVLTRLSIACSLPRIHRFVNAVVGPGGKRRMNPNGENK